LTGRDVDGDLERLAAPARALGAGLAQDPRPDLGDLAGALGDRDEHGRRDDAQPRVAPAQQRLDPDEHATRQRDLRLVVEVELVARQRPAQGAFELEALHGAGAHGVVEHLAARLAQLLGAVHRGVGVGQQRGRARPAPALAQGEPDAGRHEAGLPVEVDRRTQRVGEALDDRQRLDFAGDARQQHAELVAAEAAITSWGRSALRSRAATPSSNRSPAVWPSESLTTLKSSRSTKRTAT
jgi:hypothetical protein